jgi:hypothetical protein
MAQVLLLLCLHVLLTAPVVIAGAVVAHGRRRDPVVALTGALLGAGLAGYGVGLLWYASPSLGLWASRLLPVVALVVVVLAWRRGREQVRGAVAAVALPLTLTVLNAVTVLGLGLLWRAPGKITDLAAVRFSWRLPGDNVLPFDFLRHVERVGHASPAPVVGDWLSSDRPPLQSAMLLSHVLTRRGDGTALVDYQVGGTLLQSFWVLGLWLLLMALGVRRSAAALAVAAGMSTTVIVLNMFFVWPKLLASAFALGAVGLVLLRDRTRMGDTARLACAGACAALAYLAHGGVVFVLVPVAVLGAWQAVRSPQRWRVIGTTLVAALALVAPWTLYQRLVDPPGDRLLKWMLGEVHELDPRPVWTLVADRYRDVGWSIALENKRQNFFALIGGEPANTWRAARAAVDQGRSPAASWLRVQLFYALVPSVQLLLVLAAGWVRRSARGAAERVAANRVGLLLVVSAVFWCLVLFGPISTVLHQGTYALVLLLAATLTLVGYASWPRLTLGVVLLNGLASMVLLLPQREVEGLAWTESPVLNGWALATFVVGLVGVVLTLILLGRDDRRPAGRHRRATAGVPVDPRSAGGSAVLLAMA